MEYLTQKVRNFTNTFAVYYYGGVEEEHPVQQPKREVSKLLGYLEYGYNVLTWENPTFTWAVFLVVNFLFWFFIQFEIRIFGVVFLTILFVFICDHCLEKRNEDELNENYLDFIQDVRHVSNTVIKSFIALRKESHASFCFAMSLIFVILHIVAKHGYLLAYFALLGVFFIPLGVSKIPPETRKSLREKLKHLNSETASVAEEDLIPFISNKHLEVETESCCTDKTQASSTNSLISGISAMPSYLDEDESIILEEDLIPSRGVSLTPGDLSSDSDSEYKNIKFESGHFNGDTSSEDEARRLTCPQDLLDAVTSPDRLSGILSNMATAGSHFVSSAITTVSNMATGQRQSSNAGSEHGSSDSEFEIIHKSDVDL